MNKDNITGGDIKRTCQECLIAINPTWKTKFNNPMVDLDLSIDNVLNMVGRELIRGNNHLFTQEQLEILQHADYQLNKIGYIKGF